MLMWTLIVLLGIVSIIIGLVTGQGPMFAIIYVIVASTMHMCMSDTEDLDDEPEDQT